MTKEKPIKPKGSTVVCPYLMVDSVEVQMEFLVKVFNAKITDGSNRSNGFIQHGEVLIGDTTVMMGKSSSRWPSRQAMNYIYVKNTDEAFDRALKYGASELLRPVDRPYGIREAGFTDKFNNQWWVAQRMDASSLETLDEVDLLRKLELGWNKSIEENDVAKMATYMSDDWVIYQGDGNITTKKSFLNSVTHGDLVHTKMDFEIQKVTVVGETGIVMQKGTSAGTWMGGKFSFYEIATTVFTKNEKGWQALNTMIAPAFNPA